MPAASSPFGIPIRRRMEQLIQMSEELRQTRQGIAQAMLLDTPSNLTPAPLNGVVAPPGSPLP